MIHAIPAALRIPIADAVHTALQSIMDPAIQHAAAINTVGCYLLRHLTGATFAPIAGSIEVMGATPPLAIRAEPSRIDAHEYYLWIECEDPSGKIERVDFVSRYWRSWASQAGSIWVGPFPPPVVWGDADELRATHARYAGDSYITGVVQTALNNVFRAKDPPPQVAQWESAINGAIDLLVENPVTLPFLIEAGLAEKETNPPPGYL